MDCATTLATTVFSQTLPFSPQGRSVSPMVDCFAQVTMTTQAAVAILPLSWSFRVLPTTWTARGAFGSCSGAFGVYVFFFFLNHNTSQTPHELLVFLVKSNSGLLAML